MSPSPRSSVTCCASCDADLALALTVDVGFDRDNPYLRRARYAWMAPDPDDYGQLFDAAQAELCAERGVSAPPWRDLLAYGGTWAGRIHSAHAHPSASAVLIYCRWLLLRNLQREGLLEKYDRFIITRSDFQWLCPHPPLSVLSAENISVPSDHHWSGINDRHMVVRAADVEPCLDLLEEMLLRPAELAQAMRERSEWNDEQLLALQLRRRGLAGRVREFPYVMYLVGHRGIAAPAGPRAATTPGGPLREVRERVPRGARDGRDRPDPDRLGAGRMARSRLVRLGAPEGWGPAAARRSREDVRRRDEGPAAAAGLAGAAAARRSLREPHGHQRWRRACPRWVPGSTTRWRASAAGSGAMAAAAEAALRRLFDIVGVHPPQLSKRDPNA